MTITATTYRCTKCGNQDTDRSTDSTKAPAALNCWKCGAGRGMDLSSMLTTNTGMIIVSQESV